jgi:hypothetical protein
MSKELHHKDSRMNWQNKRQFRQSLCVFVPSW